MSTEEKLELALEAIEKLMEITKDDTIIFTNLAEQIALANSRLEKVEQRHALILEKLGIEE